MEDLNHRLFLLFNAGAHPPAWELHLALGFAKYLIVLVPFLLAGLWCWGSPATRLAAARALLVVCLGLILNVLIAHFWPQPRPFVLGLGHTWLRHAPDASFPSDHGTVFFALGLALAFSVRQILGLVIFVLGCGVAWSRVYLGVHFPFDMAGSLAVAIVSCLLIGAGWRPWGARLVAAGERLYRILFALPIAKGWIRP